MQVQKINTQMYFGAQLKIKTTEKIFNNEQLTVLGEKASKVAKPTDTILAEIGSIPGKALIKELRAVKISTSINNEIRNLNYYSADYTPEYFEIMNRIAERSGKPDLFVPVSATNSDFKLNELPFFDFLSKFMDKLAEKYPAN